MEEIRYKLESCLPSVVGSALARLTDIIIAKFVEANKEPISQPSSISLGESKKLGNVSQLTLKIQNHI